MKYLDFNNQDGPTFVLSTNEISSIIFANGQIKVYEQTKMYAFPLFCPWCKTETIVKVENYAIVVIDKSQK